MAKIYGEQTQIDAAHLACEIQQAKDTQLNHRIMHCSSTMESLQESLNNARHLQNVLTPFSMNDQNTPSDFSQHKAAFEKLRDHHNKIFPQSEYMPPENRNYSEFTPADAKEWLVCLDTLTNKIQMQVSSLSHELSFHLQNYHVLSSVNSRLIRHAMEMGDKIIAKLNSR